MISENRPSPGEMTAIYAAEVHRRRGRELLQDVVDAVQDWDEATKPKNSAEKRLHASIRAFRQHMRRKPG